MVLLNQPPAARQWNSFICPQRHSHLIPSSLQPIYSFPLLSSYRRQPFLPCHHHTCAVTAKTGVHAHCILSPRSSHSTFNINGPIYKESIANKHVVSLRALGLSRYVTLRSQELLCDLHAARIVVNSKIVNYSINLLIFPSHCSPGLNISYLGRWVFVCHISLHLIHQHQLTPLCLQNDRHFPFRRSKTATVWLFKLKLPKNQQLLG